jgi:hypothetical protein
MSISAASAIWVVDIIGFILKLKRGAKVNQNFFFHNLGSNILMFSSSYSKLKQTYATLTPLFCVALP